MPDDRTPVSGRRVRPVRRAWYLLLLLPFVATLVPPFYARTKPYLGGWPFFYWWQFAWIVITALLLAFVYRVTTRRVPPAAPREEPTGGHREDRG